MHLSNNEPEFHSFSKYIDVGHNFIREKLKDKDFVLDFLASKDMIDEFITKGVPSIKHQVYENYKHGPIYKLTRGCWN